MSNQNPLELVDLDKLEGFANEYFKCIDSEALSELKMPKSVISGLLPFLEIASKNELKALYAEAISAKKLATAALCCRPPSLGVNFPIPESGSLAKSFDCRVSGLSFRMVCLGFSLKDYPASVDSILADEHVNCGIPSKSTKIIDNGIYEISCSIALSLENEADNYAEVVDKPICSDQLFMKRIYRSTCPKIISENRFHSKVITIICDEYTENGSSKALVDFIKYCESLSVYDDTFKFIRQTIFDTLKIKLDSSTSKEWFLIQLKLILPSECETLEPYREEFYKYIETEFTDESWLKAALHLYDESRVSQSDSVVSEIGHTILDVGYDIITKSIKSDEDYIALSKIKGFDSSKIDLKLIPNSAKGAALEHDLGM